MLPGDVIMLEPNAPTSEPKIAAGAAIVLELMTRFQAFSFPAQHQQHENPWKINDRSCKQLSRGDTRPAKRKARAVAEKDQAEDQSSDRVEEA